MLQEWVRMKAARGQVNEVVRIVASLEEILQAIADRVPSESGTSAPKWAWDELRELRGQAKLSLGE